MTLNINWPTVISDLEAGLALVQQISPAAAAGGPLAAEVGQIVGAVAGYGAKALAQAQEAEAVIQSNDLAQVQALTAQIIAENDALAVQVAGS